MIKLLDADKEELKELEEIEKKLIKKINYY